MNYKKASGLTIICLMLFPIIVSSAEIYKCKDESGKTQFQDKPCKESANVKNEPEKGVADSVQLSLNTLQGKWLITDVGETLAGTADLGEDYWEFKGNSMQVVSSGHKMRPDKYKIQGNIIKLAYAKIEVLVFTDKKMKVKTLGIIQHLEKQ